MSRPDTLFTVTPDAIWPDGSGYSPEDEDEITRIARTEITPDEVSRCDQVFSTWYKYFYLAEGRFRQRREQAAKKQVEETENIKRISRLERQLARTDKHLDYIYSALLSPKKGDPKGEIVLLKVIRGIICEEMDNSKSYARLRHLGCREALWSRRCGHRPRRALGCPAGEQGATAGRGRLLEVVPQDRVV